MLAANDICGLSDAGATYFQMKQWWEIGPIRDGLQHIEDTEGGFAIEDQLGNLVLQAASHRPNRTLAATFTGLIALPNEFKIVGKPEREIAVKDVFNEVVGFIRQYETLTDELVFERQDFIQIDRGGSVELFADFEGAAVSDLDDPVSGTDYNAYENMQGTGTNWSFALDVVVEISQFNEIRVVVNYPVVTGYPAELFFTMARQRLHPQALAACQGTRRDDSSIEKYKIKTLELRDTWIQSQANMESTGRCDTGAASHT